MGGKGSAAQAFPLESALCDGVLTDRPACCWWWSGGVAAGPGRADPGVLQGAARGHAPGNGRPARHPQGHQGQPAGTHSGRHAGRSDDGVGRSVLIDGAAALPACLVVGRCLCCAGHDAGGAGGDVSRAEGGETQEEDHQDGRASSTIGPTYRNSSSSPSLPRLCLCVLLLGAGGEQGQVPPLPAPGLRLGCPP